MSYFNVLTNQDYNSFYLSVMKLYFQFKTRKFIRHKTNKSILNEQHQLSTFRFYTLQSTDFIALSFNSLCTHLSGAVSDEQIDYLLEEIEEDQEDEVSTHEDIES